MATPATTTPPPLPASVEARADDGWDDAKVTRLLHRRAAAFDRWGAKASWIGPEFEPAMLAEAEEVVRQLLQVELEVGEALCAYRDRYGHRAMAQLVMSCPSRISPAWGMRLIAQHLAVKAGGVVRPAAGAAAAKGGA